MSPFREELMKIEEILRTKGRDVVTIAESESVLAAVKVLVDRNIGSLVVLEGGRLVGILTERDVLHLTARSPGALEATSVGSLMTRDVLTTTPDDDLRDVMDTMTERKVRHLPVVAGGTLAGIVSIGDLVNACRVSAEAENSHLRRYIQSAG